MAEEKLVNNGEEYTKTINEIHMKNYFDSPFEIHSGTLFVADDMFDLFRSIVADHNLEIEKDRYGIIYALAHTGELSFKRFSKNNAVMKWEPSNSKQT